MFDRASLLVSAVPRAGVAGPSRSLLVLLACGLLFQGLPARAYEEGRNYPSPAVRPPTPTIRIAEPRAGRLSQAPERVLVYFQRFPESLDARALEVWIDGVEYTEHLHFWVDRAWLDLPPGFVWSNGSHHIAASVPDATGGTHQDIVDFDLQQLANYVWPFDYNTPNVVANLMEDYQKFSEATPYWHHGLDLRAPENAPVRASIGGYIAYAGSYADDEDEQWNVTVLGDDDYIWQYSHIRMTDVQGWNVGDRVEQGDQLGLIVTWPSQGTENGAVYHHLHLNVTEHETIDPVAWRNELLDDQTPPPAPVPEPLSDGYKWHNPLIFLSPAGDADAVAPAFGGDQGVNPPELFYLTNDTDIAVATGDDFLPNLSGDIDVVARIFDERDVVAGLVQNPNGGQPFLLGVYDVAWSVYPISTPCMLGWKPRTGLGPFDEVPGGYDGALQDLLLLDVFQRFVQDGGATYDTDFDWEFRNLIFNPSNSFYGELDGQKGYWNTDGAIVLGPLFPDGIYRVTVFAEDFLGNEFQSSHDVRVLNGLAPPPNFCPNRIDGIDLGGMELRPLAGPTIPFDPPPLPVSFPPIADGSSHTAIASASWAPWYFDDVVAGVRIALGVLDGNEVAVEYVPYLGDVILEIPAEVQLLPIVPGGPPPPFDPMAASSQPVDIRLSTRLARRPDNGMAELGDPALPAAADFRLVTAETIDVSGEDWTLLADATARSSFTMPEPGAMGLYAGIATLLALSRRRRSR